MTMSMSHCFMVMLSGSISLSMKYLHRCSTMNTMTRMNLAMSARLEANSACTSVASTILHHLAGELPGAVEFVLARMADVDDDEGFALASNNSQG